MMMAIRMKIIEGGYQFFKLTVIVSSSELSQFSKRRMSVSLLHCCLLFYRDLSRSPNDHIIQAYFCSTREKVRKTFPMPEKKTFPFHKTSAFLNLKIMRINSGHMLTLCVFLEIALDENLCTWPEILFFITSFTKKLYKKPLANLCMCVRMYLSLALSNSGGMINCNVPQFLSISLLLWSTQKKEENVTFV